MLRLEKVSVTRGGRHLVEDVSFELQGGQIAALIGPNGAGKSSVLKAVTGELALSAGSVQLFGEPWTRKSTLRARQLAVLPQASELNFPYTVAEVVELGRMPHSTGKSIDQKVVSEAMAALDIRALADRRYPELSGGEKQRTQLARVLAQIWRAEDAGNRLLLLDEPTAALDLGHQQQLMKLLQGLALQGVAVLMVVHDLNLALAYSHRLLAMGGGRLLAEGPSTEVLDEALLKTLFGADLKLVNHTHSDKPWVVI